MIMMCGFVRMRGRNARAHTRTHVRVTIDRKFRVADRSCGSRLQLLVCESSGVEIAQPTTSRHGGSGRERAGEGGMPSSSCC